MRRFPVFGIFGFVLLMILLLQENREADASPPTASAALAVSGAVAGLSNPLRAGRNSTLRVGPVPVRIPAFGQNCAVTMWNKIGCPVYTGYGRPLNDGGMNPDGGVTPATGLAICTDTSKCINPWFVRDAVPDALYARTDNPAPAPCDGGALLVLEAAGGCQNPP